MLHTLRRTCQPYMTYSYLEENTTNPSRLTSFDTYLDAGIEQNYKLAKIISAGEFIGKDSIWNLTKGPGLNPPPPPNHRYIRHFRHS